MKQKNDDKNMKIKQTKDETTQMTNDEDETKKI